MPDLLIKASPWTWPHRRKRAAFAGANLVLLYLCLAPAEALPKAQIWDKAEHAIAWAVLAGLALVLWPNRPRRAVGYALALGAIVEVLQAAMPLGRDGDWRDWVADSVGVAAAALVWAVARRLAPPLPAAWEEES